MKKAAFALFNHYYKIDNNMLVSSEPERSDILLSRPGKGRETGINKSDLLVEWYDTTYDRFSDLIYYKVKKSTKNESYTEIRNQVKRAVNQKITFASNESLVFVSFMA